MHAAINRFTIDFVTDDYRLNSQREFLFLLVSSPTKSL